MYSERWSPGLRQGDIFGRVPYPLTRSAQRQRVSVTGGFAARAEDQELGHLVKTDHRYVMVLSHDCEFNEDKRLQFLVARVEELSAKLTPAELSLLKDGNDIEAASAAGKQVAVDIFFLDPYKGLFDAPMRVNFCTMSSFSMDLADEASRLKQAELLQEERVRLRRKLGYFFGRDTEDISDADKRPRSESEEERRRESRGPDQDPQGG
jgi:hypothetical protein